MREKLTIHRAANAILQKLKPNKKEWVLLVEGKSDKLLFGKFVIKEVVEIGNCEGFSQLLEIVEIFRSRSFDNFIGILDSDFRRLDGDIIMDSQLFFTDFHDIELSILNSRAFETVLTSHEQEDRRIAFETKSKKTVLEVLYNLCQSLGYLKWASKKDDLGLVFKPYYPEGNSISYDKFIDKRSLSFISDDALITHVIQYSTNRGTTVKSKTDISPSHRKQKKLPADLKQLCNGHDMCHVFSLALKQVIGNKNVSKEILERELILAYDSSDFKRTVLYAEISNWESRNIQLFA